VRIVASADGNRLDSRLTPYEWLGTRAVINATCHWTDYGGVIVWPEVGEAMEQARGENVNVHELLDRASDAISRHTHGEATFVVSGCSAALTAGAAAILTNDDVEKMAMLPHLRDGDRRDFVAFRCPRRRTEHGTAVPVWAYAHAVRAAGARVVEVGDESGVSPDELRDAIGPTTAGVYWLSDNPTAKIALDEVVRIAHASDVPVLLDAANTLPPPQNIHAFVDLGVDLVAFSGGKGLRGPQGSGFLTGRGDLIGSARRQSTPYDGIGRALKVSKEEIVGLVTAVEVWSRRDHDADARDAMRRTRYLTDELRGIAGVRAELMFPDHVGRPYPTCFITLDESTGMSARRVIADLLAAEPSIAVMDYDDPAIVRVDVRVLEDSEVEAVAAGLRSVLTAPTAGRLRTS
jgi:D-glucosaminate-6-phosphate ammonia-lyase